MLTQIKLTNFKCFKEETAFPLSKFNLFTGVNGAGKSTVLQALLLMKQSIEHDVLTTELILNGSCVVLGSFDDVRNNQVSRENPIFFEFFYSDDNCEKNKLSMRYDLQPKVDAMSLTILEVGISLHYLNFRKKREEIEKSTTLDVESKYRLLRGNDLILIDNDKQMKESEPNHRYAFKLNDPDLGYIVKREKINEIPYYDFSFNSNVDNIYFVSADRIGPQEFYLKSTLSEFPHFGTKGEFTVNLLDKLSQELVNETLCLGDDARTLITQTQAWLGTILNPLTIIINPLKVNILELLIGGFKPSNVGFGYSILLPIIVTGLIAKPGEKIIIENPEIHLHPKAQSALIEFLVKVANTGVQIFIESHSDHILNALRIAVLKDQLTPEDTSILYFQGDNQKAVQQIPIQKDGRIEEWPENFFDQIDNDFSLLFGV